MASRKRRAPASFEWNRVPDDTDENIPQADIRIRHTHHNLDHAGPSTRRTTYIHAPPSPTKVPTSSNDYDSYNWNDEPPPPEINVDNYPFIDPAYRFFLDDNDIQEPQEASRRRKRTVDDDPLRKWIPDRDNYLQELLRLDGRAGAGYYCGLCQANGPAYRCENCFGGLMFCQGCIVSLHACMPLHRIERWEGAFFERATLKGIGLRVQLGHRVGDRCINPQPATGDDFVVVDVSGVHEVGLDYCACTTALGPVEQLLRARWFPATTIGPKTAATFVALEHFQLLTFESKASVFEFYRTLMRRVDNTGTVEVPDRYNEFLRMIREWRNLKMLKRAGRGHDPGGVDATQEGECAILCPACPQPGKNLPDDWKSFPKEIRWLFRSFKGADANFKMVRYKVSSEAADPTLSAGLSYFGEVTKYKTHLDKYGDQVEVRTTCVKHHAVKDANTKRSENLASTGIGTIDCIRHNLKCPCSVGDLQKGEKYVNMDYLFLSCVSRSDFVELVMSYDIVCQWHKHLWERMLAFPDHFHIDLEGKTVTFLVPKFHLPAHVASCQTAFSFNLTRGVGRTDGEAVERGWANINPAAGQTKVMGPASRRETLDDHLGDWNHQKVIGFGKGLLRKVQDAVPERAEHVSEFTELTDSLPAASVLEWTEMVERWENDNQATNPFVVTAKSITQHGVRLALAEEDAADMQRENEVPVHDDITPAMLISSGLELEANQVRLKRDSNSLDSSATSLQLAKIQERKNALHRKIKAWTVIQHLYMPAVSVLRARADRAASDHTPAVEAYDFQLRLPSSLPLRTACPPKLHIFEFKLREAQAYEALEDIRQHLRLRTHMYKYKDKNSVGQRANTRSQNLINRVQKKIQASSVKYNTARQALITLASHVDDVGWRSKLLPLAPEDIRAFTDGEPGQSEGRRTLSWIWKVVGVSDDSEDDGVQEALRIEWCRSRARAMRWTEEVLLLREEMRRVLAFLQWHAEWWEERQNVLQGLEMEHEEGVVAYARKQAQIRWSIRTTFKNMWRNTADSMSWGLGVDNEILDLGLAATSRLSGLFQSASGSP